MKYNINNVPDRLKGLGVEKSLKTVNYVIDSAQYIQHGNDHSFRNDVKNNISRLIAEEVVKIAKFTMIDDPHTHDVTVIGRIVVMTEDQLNSLISAAA
jgi:hypothetical protein